MQRIEVMYLFNGTRKLDAFTAASSSSTLLPHAAVIDLVDGRDHAGRAVLSAHYGVDRRVIRYEEGP